MKRLIFINSHRKVEVDPEGIRVLQVIENQKCTITLIVNDEEITFIPEMYNRREGRKGIFVYVDEMSNIILRSNKLLEFKSDDLRLIHLSLQLCTCFLYVGYYRTDKQDKQLHELCQILNPVDTRIARGYWCVMNSLKDEDNSKYMRDAYSKEKKLDRQRFMKMITRQRVNDFQCILFPDRVRKDRALALIDKIFGADRGRFLFNLCEGNILQGKDLVFILKEYVRHFNEGYVRVFRKVVENIFFDHHTEETVAAIRKRYNDKVKKFLLPQNEGYLRQENEKLLQRVFRSNPLRYRRLDQKIRNDLNAEFSEIFNKRLEENEQVVNERCKRLLLKQDSKHIKTLKLYNSVGDFERDVRLAKKEFLTELNLGRDKMNFLKQFLKIQRIRKMLLSFALDSKEKKRLERNKMNVSMKNVFKIRRESMKYAQKGKPKISILAALAEKRKKKIEEEKMKERRKRDGLEPDDEEEEVERGYFEKLRKDQRKKRAADHGSRRHLLSDGIESGFISLQSSCVVHNDRFKVFKKRQELFNFISQMYQIGFSVTSLTYFNGKYYLNTRRYLNRKFEEKVVVCKSVHLEETVTKLREEGLRNMKTVLFDGEMWTLIVRNDKARDRDIEICIIDDMDDKIEELEERMVHSAIGIVSMAIGDFYMVVCVKKRVDCDYRVHRGTMDIVMKVVNWEVGEQNRRLVCLVNVGMTANCFLPVRKTSIEKLRRTEEKKRLRKWKEELKKISLQSSKKKGNEEEEEEDSESEEEKEKKKEDGEDDDDDDDAKKKKEEMKKYPNDYYLAVIKERRGLLPSVFSRVVKRTNVEGVVEKYLKRGYILRKFTT